MTGCIAHTSIGQDELVAGARRVRPDDHFMILAETDASPMHIGTLMFLDVPAGEREGLTDAIRRQVVERLPATPLLARLVQSPGGYDSDVWADIASCDLDRHVSSVRIEGGEDADVRAFVARASMERLDLEHPPFAICVLDGLKDGRAALYLKMHHAVADGIGFQSVLALLSDAQPPVPSRVVDVPIPDETRWHALAKARFEKQAGAADAHGQQRRAARAELMHVAPRPETPGVFTTPTSAQRSYATLSLPFDKVKALSKAAGGTINDLFLALAAGATRTVLGEMGKLPNMPIVANSARSYRRSEHGSFGNRIVAMHPHLATHISDPIARLRAIQGEMARELARTLFDEAMLDAPETPFGACERRERMALRGNAGAQLIPGNVTVSNVPGPAEHLSYAGYRVCANFPVPILGSGRFLNITSRRNADRLDLGVMADAEKIADAQMVANALEDVLELYRRAFG